MGSRTLTYTVLAALLVVAVAVVAGSVAKQRGAAGPADAMARAVDQVVCPVCGSLHLRGEMHEITLDIVGYAPDSTPLLVCSEGCEALAKQSPEVYNPVTATIRAGDQRKGPHIHYVRPNGSERAGGAAD